MFVEKPLLKADQTCRTQDMKSVSISGAGPVNSTLWSGLCTLLRGGCEFRTRKCSCYLKLKMLSAVC